MSSLSGAYSATARGDDGSFYDLPLIQGDAWSLTSIDWWVADICRMYPIGWTFAVYQGDVPVSSFRIGLTDCIELFAA
jgi:hypothetical protein